LISFASVGCVNLHAVEEGRVYRCAQPSVPQLTNWIWRYDIKTVLRLRGGGPGEVTWEASHEPTVKTGIDFAHLSMSARSFPSAAQLVGLCEIFETAEYPLLLHCMAGADRTGLASAVYMMHRTGDLALARGQLSFKYLHVSWSATGRLDQVLDMYEPWHGHMTFCEWARQVYERPHDNELPAGYIEEQRSLRALSTGS
jgi:protein tyrosine phosphatase (PTP) superfamily phosphohydrolase (DUF442 family)